MLSINRKVRVLVVDDSAVARTFLTRGLSSYPNIEVVGYAVNALDARGKISSLAPDVMTLDVEMPGTNGIDFLKELLPVTPLPVILVSSLNLKVFDALAAGDLERLCCSIQISDAGLTPGSGVGNHRKALNRAVLGVPVISVGVPTVVDAATVAVHVLEEAGLPAPEDCAALRGRGTKLFVTPDGIDRQIRELAAVLARGISLALQPGLSYEDLEALLS